MFDQIIKFSIHHKLIVAIFTIILIITGLWSATQLTIDALPDITNNQVQIITTCPNLATEEVELQVTAPIELGIANIPKIIEVRSISRSGLSVITVVFSEQVNPYLARQWLNEALQKIKDDIPPDFGTPTLAPLSSGLGEVFQYVLVPEKGYAHQYSLSDLREIQDWIVARQLYGIEGVAEINSHGGLVKQYEVSINPFRLASMGISIAEVYEALAKNNQNMGGAYIDKVPNAYFIRGVGKMNTKEDIENTSIKLVGRQPILVRDVAQVTLGHAPRYGAMSYNGRQEVAGGIVMMLRGANSNQVVSKIKDRLKIIEKTLPKGIKIVPFVDRMELVDNAIKTIIRNLLEGALIVIFMLILFLGNLRAGLIVASAIPLSLLFALSLMHFFGVSANLMSLGAIDFGLIIDGALIIVEFILHQMTQNPAYQNLTIAQKDDSVYAAASQIRKSASFGEFIILIVYLPILTLQGVEGKMFQPMAQTVMFAIIGALILSLTYIPMMCAWLLKPNISKFGYYSEKFFELMKSNFLILFNWAIMRQRLLMGLTLGLFLGSIILYLNMGAQFIPTLQEGNFAFHCILPKGSGLKHSIEASMQASRVIKRFDEVASVVAKTGAAEIPTDPMPFEGTDLMIRLKPKDQWKEKKSYEALSKEIIEALHDIPGVFFEENQPIQMRFNELMSGVRQDLALKIFGENIDSLTHYAEAIAQVLGKIEGASTPQVERTSGVLLLQIDFNRNKLATYGLSIAEVSDIIATSMAGKSAGFFYENERRFELVVRLDTAYRNDTEILGQLIITTSAGLSIPLNTIADISLKPNPIQISRESGKRKIVIGVNAENRDIVSLIEDVKNKIDQKVKLPEGYFIEYGGSYEQLQSANKRLMVVLPIALVSILLLLYFAFGNLSEALLIFISIPLSSIGGILAIVIRGIPFSVSASVGFIALFGVSVLNGIVLVSVYQKLAHEKKPSSPQDWIAIIREGTLSRLRPVLMTALIASFGFLPMAYGDSIGSEIQKPLATVVIGGLVSATILTLLVFPLLFYRLKIKDWSFLKPTKSFMSIGLILIGCSFTISAQHLQINSLGQAYEIAKEKNGLIKSIEFQVKSMKSLEKTSFELPNFEINVQYGKYNSDLVDNSIQLQQTIPFPTTFVHKAKLLETQRKLKEKDLEMEERSLYGQVARQYYKLQYQNSQYQIYRHIDSIYEELLRIADLRLKVGDIQAAQRHKIALKRHEVKMNIQDLNLIYLQEFHSFKALLGTDDSLQIIFDQKDSVFYRSIEIQGLDSNDLLAIARDQMALEIENQRFKVQKSLLLPEITIGYNNQTILGFQRIGSNEVFFDENHRFSFWNAGISFPISFWASNARNKAMQYDIKSKESELIQNKRNWQVEIQGLKAKYWLQAAQISTYQNDILKLSEQTMDAALLAYKLGDMTFWELYTTLEEAKTTKIKYLNLCQMQVELYFQLKSLFKN
ncbi:MAG: CusA/CzcA family heavy metal efflux RND transporter [Chitinophagales bacterium]|jgi:cobalt-zinc-cadmium resistance protein CzcA|nr:CusA/CzcA family heavy metal efflux RND transporter [Chitinophagales bacterium]